MSLERGRLQNIKTVFYFCGTISPSIFALLLIADYIITNFIDYYVQDEGF